VSVPILPGAEPFAHDGSTEIGVLLCHGFTGTPQSMAPWGARLAEIGWSTRCPLLPGHGTRWQDMNRTDWPAWYSAVDTTFAELAQRCATVFVFGLSMGGTLALRLAERRGPAVAGLVLVNPSVTTERRDAPLLPVLSRIVPSMPGISSDIKKPGVTELAYGRLPLRAAASLSKLWQEVRRDLGDIDQPLLLFRSAVDHVVEPVNATIVLGGVSSTDTREVVLPDSYHVATLDNDASTIFEGSVDFVRRVVAAPAVAPVESREASAPREGT
jgi:carboxylesterase